MQQVKWLVVVPVLATACDSLAGGDYVGEPLITLAGTFAPTSAPPAEVGGIALLWQDAEGSGGPGKAIVAVPVSIEFPTRFAVQVPAPPPDDVTFAFADGTRLAECYVYVVADDTDTRQFLGADRTHALVWTAGDVSAGTAAAAYLGGAVTAGYHLRRYTTSPQMSPEQQTLVDRCTERGEPVDACAARHHYQLTPPIAEDEPLRIVLWPP